MPSSTTPAAAHDNYDDDDDDDESSSLGEIRDDDHSLSDIDLETCVIEIKRASRDNNKKKKRDCRICHLGLVNNKNGLEEEEEEEEEEEYGGAPIHLGCSCKGDLAAAHKKCAETWFKIKGNMTCEIFGATALNVGMEHIINEVNAAATTATSAALAAQTPVIVVGRESFWNGRRLMNFLLAWNLNRQCLVSTHPFPLAGSVL